MVLNLKYNMYIIPAIDILDGKVVRLREGDYDQKTVYDVSIADMIDTYNLMVQNLYILSI